MVLQTIATLPLRRTHLCGNNSANELCFHVGPVIPIAIGRTHSPRIKSAVHLTIELRANFILTWCLKESNLILSGFNGTHRPTLPKHHFYFLIKSSGTR